MIRQHFRLLGYLALMLLGFAPLIFWSSNRRYEYSVEAAVHAQVILAAEERPEQGHAKEGYCFPVADKGLKDIISGFGDARGNRRHEGIDIKAGQGTPVLAIADGVVERIKNGGKGGRQIWLKMADGRQAFYAHLQEQWVEEGESVRFGQAIGSVGNTGNARHTSPHLHFEIIFPAVGAVDPIQYLKQPQYGMQRAR